MQSSSSFSGSQQRSMRNKIEPEVEGDQMKLTKLIFALTLTLVLGGPVAKGQTAPTSTNPGPDTAQSVTKTYRLTYTLTETDGGKRIGTQHFSMIVVNGRKTVLKQGSRIPLATGTSTNSALMQTQIQYMDVGLNIDASLDASVDVVRLSTKVEQSSLAEEKSGWERRIRSCGRPNWKAHQS